MGIVCPGEHSPQHHDESKVFSLCINGGSCSVELCAKNRLHLCHNCNNSCWSNSTFLNSCSGHRNSCSWSSCQGQGSSCCCLDCQNRGRRSVGPSTLSLEGLVSLESEHCYKRSFCYAATGKEEKMTPLLVLLDSCNAASSPKAVKFCEAAGLGQKFRSLEKCELRYKCSLDRDFIQDMFNQ